MCICVCFVVRYIGEVQSEKLKQNRSMISTQPYSLPNPIITVTEHTPTPSPDYMRRQVIWFMCLLVSVIRKLIYARRSCFVCEHAHMQNVGQNILFHSFLHCGLTTGIRTEVTTAVDVHIAVLWFMTLCSCVSMFQKNVLPPCSGSKSVFAWCCYAEGTNMSPMDQSPSYSL